MQVCYWTTKKTAQKVACHQRDCMQIGCVECILCTLHLETHDTHASILLHAFSGTFDSLQKYNTVLCVDTVPRALCAHAQRRLSLPLIERAYRIACTHKSHARSCVSQTRSNIAYVMLPPGCWCRLVGTRSCEPPCSRVRARTHFI